MSYNGEEIVYEKFDTELYEVSWINPLGKYLLIKDIKYQEFKILKNENLNKKNETKNDTLKTLTNFNLDMKGGPANKNIVGMKKKK